MKILVIDNKESRHSFHYDLLTNEFPNDDIKIVENLDDEKLKKSNYDVIIVHRNNPENDIIERNEHIGRLRIIFSGGLPKYEKHSGSDHYVPYSQLKNKIKSIVTEYVKNTLADAA